MALAYAEIIELNTWSGIYLSISGDIRCSPQKVTVFAEPGVSDKNDFTRPFLTSTVRGPAADVTQRQASGCDLLNSRTSVRGLSSKMMSLLTIQKGLSSRNQAACRTAPPVSRISGSKENEILRSCRLTVLRYSTSLEGAWCRLMSTSLTPHSASVCSV